MSADDSDNKQPRGASSPEMMEAIYREFRDRLFGYIRRKVPTEHDAEDILQEVFIRIQSNLDRVEDSERTTAWIFRVAANAIADLYRAQSRVQRHAESVGRHAARHDEEISLDPDPTDVLARCMQPLVDQIPDEYSQAISLTDLGGMTQRDAAEELGITLPAMKSRVQRGRSRIRDLLVACCAIEIDRRGGIISYRRREGGEQCGCSTDSCGCADDESSCGDEACSDDDACESSG